MVQLQSMYEQAINGRKELESQINLLEQNNAAYVNRINQLTSKLHNIENENAEIKQTIWYRLFGKK